MIGKWTDKYPDEQFPNSVDWAAILDGATIITSTAVTMLGDVDIIEVDFDGPVQEIWIAGGSPGLVRVRCGIQTSDERHLEVIAQFSVIS